MPAPVDYTIAVLVKDGLESAMTFASLLCLRDIPVKFEVLVLHDDIPTQLEGALAVLDYFGVSVVRIPMQGASIVEKRNKALEVSKSKELIFLDDDMLVTEEAIRQLMRRAEFGKPFLMVPTLSPYNWFSWSDYVPFDQVQAVPLPGIRPHLYNMEEGKIQLIACGFTNALALYVPLFKSEGGFQTPRPPFPWLSDVWTTLQISKKQGPGVVVYGHAVFPCERSRRYITNTAEETRRDISRELYAEAQKIEQQYY